MSFTTAFKLINDAVDVHPVDGIADVSIRDGMMWADDGRLCAAVPFAWEGEDFSAKAAPIAKAFRVFGATAKMVDKGTKIQIRAGRRSVTVSKSDRVRTYVAPSETRHDLHTEFVPALKRLAPFMSDDRTKPYVCALLVRDEHVYACNNIIAAATSVASADMDVTIPDTVVNYLTKRGDAPAQYALDDNHVTFFYADGSFVRGTRLTQEMPEAVVNMAHSAFDIECEPLSVDWVAHVKTIMELSDDELHITPDAIYTETDAGAVSARVDIKTAIDGETIWNPKFLKLVLAHAAEMDFSAYPAPCAWSGNSCVGLIVGRK